MRGEEPLSVAEPFSGFGNTSACAEKRLLSPGAVRENRKYLHMRGEEMRSLRISWFISEIPPHARRRDPHSRIIHIAGGNTSACAEKSISCPLPPPLSRKYLRMRGEESPDKRCHAPYREISPHARRRVPTMVATIIFRGNTSACAEKSLQSTSHSRGTRKYLRMRGEEIRAA